jgi:hypothetical protein
MNTLSGWAKQFGARKHRSDAVTIQSCFLIMDIQWMECDSSDLRLKAWYLEETI